MRRCSELRKPLAGTCCEAPGQLTQDGFCCAAPLDRCGACGDGSACAPEATFTLAGVPDSALATVAADVRAVMCAEFGFPEAGCPFVVAVGSGVAPASRSRRMRALRDRAWRGGRAHDTGDYRHLQAQDVGARAFAAAAAHIGARPLPHAAVFGPDVLWRDHARTGRHLAQAADALEVAVRPFLCLGICKRVPASFPSLTPAPAQVAADVSATGDGVGFDSLLGMSAAASASAPAVEARTGASVQSVRSPSVQWAFDSINVPREPEAPFEARQICWSLLVRTCRLQ